MMAMEDPLTLVICGASLVFPCLLPPFAAELNPGLTDGTTSSLGFMLVKVPLQGEILQGKSPAIVLCKVQLVDHRVFSRWFDFIIFCFILQLSA